MGEYKIDEDEWYPVYSIDERHGWGTIELTDDEYKDYQDACRKFQSWQDRLKKACGGL